MVSIIYLCLAPNVIYHWPIFGSKIVMPIPIISKTREQLMRLRLLLKLLLPLLLLLIVYLLILC